MTGLNLPGFPKPDVAVKTSKYYDNRGKSLSVDTPALRVMFFPWNINDTNAARKNFKTLQVLGEFLIDFSFKINIVDISYDVVGGSGDFWVSQPAKEDFLELLSVIDTSLQVLIFQLTEFLKTQEKPRDSYNQANQLDGKTGWNPNFYKIMHLMEEIDKNGNVIHNATSQIRNIIHQYPVSSKTLALKEVAFSNQMRILKGLSPVFPPVGANNEINESAPLTVKLLQTFKIKLNEINQLRFMITANKKGMIHFSKPGLDKFKTEELSNKFESQTSVDWANEFLTVHKHFFIKYNKILNKLMLAIENKDFHRLALLQIDLTKSFGEMLALINHEKPQWRFKYFIIPVSVGWPFHRQARRFANLLYEELATTFFNVTEFITKTTTELDTQEEIEQLRENESSSLILLANSIKQTNYKALQTSHQLIAQRFAREASNKQKVSEFLAAFTEEKTEVVVPVALEVENPLPSLIKDLSEWTDVIYQKYSVWMRSKYLDSIEYFVDENIALSSLKNVLEVLDELRINDDQNQGSTLSATARDVMTTLCKQLDAVPKRVPDSPNRVDNLEQVGLMKDFLKICLETDLAESAQLKINFRQNCKNVFYDKRIRAAQNPDLVSSQVSALRSGAVTPVATTHEATENYHQFRQ